MIASGVLSPTSASPPSALSIGESCGADAVAELGACREAQAGDALLDAREIGMGKWRRPRGRLWCRHAGRAVLQILEAQEVCGWMVRPWDRRDGSAARDEGRGRIDHLLHLQQQCLGLRTNLRFATIDRSPVPTDSAQADRGRFHRKCGAGLAERLKRSAIAASFVRRS